VSESRFARLIDLARETSSDRRRDLLRDVTDLFFDTRDSLTPIENALVGEIMAKVTQDMEFDVRAALSNRLAEAGVAPAGIALKLASDEIVVAAPILQHSSLLSDDDLIAIVLAKGAEHHLAVTQRSSVSERVSDALVMRGDDEVVARLLRNEGARLSRQAYEQVFDRAKVNPALHEPAVGNAGAPPGLLNEIYFEVSEKLRKAILARNEELDPKVLDEALAQSRERMAMAAGALPADYAEEQAWIARRRLRGAVPPGELVQMLRDGHRTRFTILFADILGLPFHVVRKLVDKPDLDGMAMACRAADVERPAFVTIAVLTAGGDKALGQAEKLGGLYHDVPLEAARRAMRFWKMRAQAHTENVAA
jgi:uncharacterized protein (DUF2336 family)